MARYSKEHKAETRQKIIEETGRAFREDGFDKVSVATLMERAGLTHGGFYAHFQSKDELIAETLVHSFKDAKDRISARAARGRRKNGQPLANLIDEYLSKAHRDHPAQGCTIAALGSDIARQPDSVKRELEDEISDWIDSYAEHAHGDRDVAITILSAMIGAMQLSRAMSGTKDSVQILEAVKKTLLHSFATTGDQ